MLRRALSTLPLLAFVHAGCTGDVTVPGPNDTFWDDEYTHDVLDDEEPMDSVPAGGTTVQTAATTGACTTSVVRGLAEQLVQEMECIRPGTMGKIGGTGITIGAAVFPYLQKPAADALRRVAATRAVTVTSAVRTVVQQFVLYSWYRNGRCTSVVSLAAPPGRSNHESGLAVDVSNYGAVKATMTGQGFRWLGSSDPVHFDYNGTDLRSRSVLAFQRLWNKNNPGARISEDGAYGPQTEGAIKKAPAAGFAIGSACGALPASPRLAIDVTRAPTAADPDAFAVATDPSVARLEYWVDGEQLAEVARDAGGRFPAPSIPAGEATLEVLGYDAAGALVASGAPIIEPALTDVMPDLLADHGH